MPRLSRVVRCLVATLMVAAMLPTTSSAQITRGGISGTVRDASGGVVPGATVTVTNMDTNASQTHVSDAQGFYRAAALEPGRYMVITELTGFRRVEQKEVIVRSALETPVDVRLSPATVGEEVTVTAESPLVGLNRTNPTIASTVNARQVVELPLAGGRNLNNLILTVPNSASTDGPGHVCGQRQSAAQQQLHGRRLGQQRHLGDDFDLADRARGRGRVPGPAEPVQRRVRAQQRRTDQRHHEVRHQSLQRRHLGLLPGERPELADEHREGQRSGRRPRD